MTTQEEIREGMKNLLKEYHECGYINMDCECSDCLNDRDKVIEGLLEYLHSKGVVIKTGEDIQPLVA